MKHLQKTSRYFLQHLIPRHALDAAQIARLHRVLRREDPRAQRRLAWELSRELAAAGVFRDLGDDCFLDLFSGRRFRLPLSAENLEAVRRAEPDSGADGESAADAARLADSASAGPRRESGGVREPASEKPGATSPGRDGESGAPDSTAGEPDDGVHIIDAAVESVEAADRNDSGAARTVDVSAGPAASTRMGDILEAIRFEGGEPDLLDGLCRLLALIPAWFTGTVIQLYHFQPLGNGDIVPGMRLLEPEVLSSGHPYRKVLDTKSSLTLSADEMAGSWYPPRVQVEGASWILCPLSLEDEAWGLLELQCPPSVDRHDCEGALRLLAMAMSYHKRNHGQLSSVVYVDWLTKIFNRSFLDMQLPLEIERATRNSEPLALLVADLDDFKRINDTYGHDVGDVVLREFATLLKATLRKVDQLFRYGGEEFVVLLPRLDRDSALRAGERLREAVARHRVRLDDGRELSVTCSIGGAIFPLAALTEQSLFKAADQACYQAKGAGKNCVVFARQDSGPAKE